MKNRSGTGPCFEKPGRHPAQNVPIHRLMEQESGNSGGLVEAAEILQNIEGIAIHRLSERDVVRHRLVKAIIGALRGQP